jgi:hypothetical protein
MSVYSAWENGMFTITFLHFTYQNDELIALHAVWRCCDYMNKSTPARNPYSASILTPAKCRKSDSCV